MSAVSFKIKKFGGFVPLPGDKSISHRSFLVASQAIGKSKISGVSNGLDIYATINALRSAGVKIEKVGNTDYEVSGVGVGGLLKPDNALYMGNSGTSVALLSGLFATYEFDVVMYGDSSLTRRPMSGFMKPLSIMGAKFSSDKMPFVMTGSDMLIPIIYEMPIMSAQVKSALLFAGLNIRGKTTVIEKMKTRSHTEKMLHASGADICLSEESNGTHIDIRGSFDLHNFDSDIPKDPSAVAFFVAAAVLADEGSLFVENVLMTDERSGFYQILQNMGANIEMSDFKTVNGESVVNLKVRSSELRGVEVPSSFLPSTVDEYPILAIVASFCYGVTSFAGLSRLRTKESDRLNAIVNGLTTCGVQLELYDKDSVRIFGKGRMNGGCNIEAFGDHRIAMSFLVAGAFADNPITVEGEQTIDSSFPGFISVFNSLGGNILPKE